MQTCSFEVFSGIQLFSRFCVIIYNVYLCGAHAVSLGKPTLSGQGILNLSHNNLNERNSLEKSKYRYRIFANLDTKIVSEFHADKQFSKIKFRKRQFSIDKKRVICLLRFHGRAARPLFAAQLYMNVEFLVEGLKS